MLIPIMFNDFNLLETLIISMLSINFLNIPLIFYFNRICRTDKSFNYSMLTMQIAYVLLSISMLLVSIIKLFDKEDYAGLSKK